jgi:phenylacetate-CoA ligase
MLWLRETFGDIVQVFTEPCPCGRSGFRYKIVGRADDMLKVKGVMVYPAAIDGVITGFTPRVTGEFRIVLDTPPPRVVPPLVLRVEHGENVPAEQLPALAAEIEERMRATLRIGPRVEWVAPRTFGRTGGKTNFFERRY